LIKMNEDLAAFFAKKANKNKDRKKKGVINIEDVGQQLERKAKIQEEGDYQGEEQERKSSLETISKNNPNVEDSEWIDFNEKPSLEKFTFKEFKEPNEDELEEEKRRLKEPNKTWNTMESQKEVSVESVVTEPTRYVPKFQRKSEKVVDINNPDMFPSIADASEVEKNQKAQDEERRNEFEEQKKRKDEARKREEEKRTKPSTPMRPYQHEQSEMVLSPGNRKPYQRSASPTAPTSKNIEPSEADGANTWRRDKPSVQVQAPRMTESTIESKAQSAADDSAGWRSNLQSSEQKLASTTSPTKEKVTPLTDEPSRKATSGDKSTSANEGGWRTVEPKKSTTSEAQKAPETASPAQTTGKYVPPWMRNK
jgi:ABC-type Zn2+ transport system substrate-binding protein/surface adhesin